MQARGIFLTVLSAVLYGLNPLFSKTINVGSPSPVLPPAS